MRKAGDTVASTCPAVPQLSPAFPLLGIHREAEDEQLMLVVQQFLFVPQVVDVEHAPELRALHCYSTT